MGQIDITPLRLTPMVKNNFASRIIGAVSIALAENRSSDLKDFFCFLDRVIRKSDSSNYKQEGVEWVIGEIAQYNPSLALKVSMTASSFTPVYYYDVKDFPIIHDPEGIPKAFKAICTNLPEQEAEMIFNEVIALIADYTDKNESADILLEAIHPDTEIANYVKEHPIGLGWKPGAALPTWGLTNLGRDDILLRNQLKVA